MWVDKVGGREGEAEAGRGEEKGVVCVDKVGEEEAETETGRGRGRGRRGIEG